MANTFQVKRSTSSGSTPSSSDLAEGEIAINTADGLMFFKKSDNSIQTVGGGSGGSSSDEAIVMAIALG